MRFRHIFISILIAAFLAPAYGQSIAGSSIASKTLLPSDDARKVEQRVYDNGLGDIVQEITSYTGSTLPSIVVRHEYDEYRRETKTWLPVASSSGSGFVSGSSIANLARSQYNSDSAPFSRTDYDAFLPSLPSAQFKAGAKWQDNGNPSRIYFTNGSETRYVYSATGQKLTVEHYTAKPNITRQFGVKPSGSTQDQIIFAGHTDYLLGGRLVVKENIIRRLLFDGGYAAAAPVGSTTYGLTLCHYNKDHLGNNREVVTSGGTVQQVTNYYPFGAPYADPATVEHPSLQPYKYNGKELDTMHGLNTYDYGARQYDPVLGRWDRMDPLCEKYYSVSPYVYCENDPVSSIDPDGRSAWKVLSKGLYKVGKTVVKNGFSSLGKAATYTAAFKDVVDDTKTLFDSNASTSDRVTAGLSLLSEAISPVSYKEGKALVVTAKRHTSRAARRKVMRDQGIPTSQQPKSQSKNDSGYEYTYEIQGPYGTTDTKSVQQQTKDRSHNESHWEAGSIKTDNGKPEMNKYGRARLRNSKSKAEYE